MKHLVKRLIVVSGAIVLMAGVVACAERFLFVAKGWRRRRNDLDGAPPSPAGEAATAEGGAGILPTARTTERKFSIKRTKSEVGYVYWILEGFGSYKCFVLCDSWEEAVAQAKARLEEIDGTHISAGVSASTHT